MTYAVNIEMVPKEINVLLEWEVNELVQEHVGWRAVVLVLLDVWILLPRI
jgi:hypothetical protein